uniref:ELYS protein n=1 Tax=Angiostrongylus cantonensis TaxID=6313 RepID=A0A0K0CV45_ANGCA
MATNSGRLAGAAQTGALADGGWAAAVVIEMTSVVKWRAAFLEIYGRTPTKSDYIMAPNHVKEEYFGGSVASSSFTGDAPRRAKVCLKRPRLEDENSPMKKPLKARRQCENSEIMGTRTDLTKASFASTISSACSPVHILQSVKFGKTLNSTSGNSDTASGKAKLISSPRTSSKVCVSGARPAELPVFTSLFDTPEKGQPAAWSDISPQKTMVFTQTSGEPPLRSPRKPFLQKEFSVKNAEYLLLPTPEKCERKEILEPFMPEKIPSRKRRASKKDTAVAFYPEKGHVVKREFKRPTPNNSAPSKKLKGNYVKVNLKKKIFSRGKVSAEQKRKMRRRQKWKRIENGEV